LHGQSPAWQATFGACVFIDWAAGGDETVIAALEGNRLRIVVAFRERDACQCVLRVAATLRDSGLIGTPLSADAGGIGGPMCDQLGQLGFSPRRINNGAPARKKDTFANVDAERWFAFRRLVEKREIILPKDGELLKQLCSRRLQYDAKARIQLEPKELMRSRGLSSPDRADAIIGAATAGLPGFTGAVTAQTLAGMKFGGFAGSRTLFGEADYDPPIPLAEYGDSLRFD
jgi:hypothetical protein